MKIYDNGEKVLGRVYDVKDYLCKNSNDETDVREVINDLENYDDDTMVVVDYSFGMGYRVEYWTNQDIITRW